MIRYAVIGTGWIARSFIDGAASVPGLSLAAVYSRREETGRAFVQDFAPDLPVYTDLEALAGSPDIDAVYIASPNHMHYAQSKTMLLHGKHVICEKPVAVRPEEVEELQTLARSRWLVYMEAIIMLHLPQRVLLKEAVAQLGRIRSAHIDFSQLSSKYHDLMAGNLPNIFNPACCTGALMDLGLYCVYFAAYLWGMPDSVQARATFIPSGADIGGACILGYPDLTVTLSYAKAGQDRCGSQIQGDKGTLTLESVSQLSGIRLWQEDGSSRLLWGPESRFVMMSGEALDFVRYITRPEETRQEYEENAALALTVSRIMAQMRSAAGIHFPGEPEQ